MVAVSVYLAFAVVLLTIAYMKYFFRFRREGEAPYTPGHFLWGNCQQFAKHAVHFLHRSQKSLGDIFTIRLLNQHVTMVMDPHCFEQFSKEKNFDFDPIQKQVNHNVFGFELKEARKMIHEAGKKVNGRYLSSGMENFAGNLVAAFEKIQTKQTDSGNGSPEKHQEEKEEETQAIKTGLRIFTARTMFDALFYTIFGKDSNGTEAGVDVDTFNPETFHANFDIFHKFFNYLWLGLPVNLFSKAVEALNVLCHQPTANGMMQRDGVSDYIKFSTSYMLEHDQTATDIIGHNLVFLHVNYNTFRVNYWCVYHLLEKKLVRQALVREFEDIIEAKRVAGEDQVGLTIEDFDKLPLLDSFLKETLRMASGVFVVRKVVEDTDFTMPDGKVYSVRKGDRVAMYPPAHHMDAEIFEDPETFKFDRFVDAKFFKYGKELKNPLIGFGSLCPGKRMAMLQIKWFLINLLNTFSMELEEGESTEANTEMYGHEILPPVRDVQINYNVRPGATKIVFLPRQYSSS